MTALIRKRHVVSPALQRKIRRHRRAFQHYGQLIPLGDPIDLRFSPDHAGMLDRVQRQEYRARMAFLAHRVGSLADVTAKAGYLLGHAKSEYQISGPEELGVFLRSLIPRE
ncbi:hypothetical protein [Devosia sp. Leaf64]|uniref:hypothetical protein n=1 Tax=Devosia sp. Leaf64 TaxID=1736229 RepID=UPI000ACF6FED|nr:hypothetical protein [Devosia sp. Leaf64]